jgi:hypothetical protein
LLGPILFPVFEDNLNLIIFKDSSHKLGIKLGLAIL